MKQKYEKAVLTVTHFSEDDVIRTSDIDKNNAYNTLSELNEQGSRMLAPTR